jgi:hypothetical protein
MSSPRCYIGQILAEIAFGLQSLLEVLHIKVHKVYESSSLGIRVTIHRQTDEWTDMTNLTVAFEIAFLKTDKFYVCWRNCILILSTFKYNLNFIGPLWSVTVMYRVRTVSDI